MRSAHRGVRVLEVQVQVHRDTDLLAERVWVIGRGSCRPHRCPAMHLVDHDNRPLGRDAVRAQCLAEPVCLLQHVQEPLLKIPTSRLQVPFTMCHAGLPEEDQALKQALTLVKSGDLNLVRRRRLVLFIGCLEIPQQFLLLVCGQESEKALCLQDKRPFILLQHADQLQLQAPLVRAHIKLLVLELMCLAEIVFLLCETLFIVWEDL
mmetsp:Transcript_121338/g.387834  ORF Transcript_121338/g.387834 Transcript_121338/m.387834 type:complete len:207 (-) Transcript_121338:829-1449(-)